MGSRREFSSPLDVIHNPLQTLVQPATASKHIIQNKRLIKAQQTIRHTRYTILGNNTTLNVTEHAVNENMTTLSICVTPLQCPSNDPQKTTARAGQCSQ